MSVETSVSELPFFEENHPKLANKLGINRRYLTQDPGEAFAKRSEIIPEMGKIVLKKAMSQKDWSPDELDELLVSTSYPYGESPSEEIARLTGAENAYCHDYYAACAGFLMALCDLYDKKETLEIGEKIAIVASEQYSTTVDREHGINRFVFGDGASCFLFGMKDLEILCCKSLTLKDKAGLIRMPNIKPPSYPSQTSLALNIPESESAYVEMDNKAVLSWLKKEDDLELKLTHPIDLADEMLTESDYKFSDIDVLICHQSSGPALDALEGFAKEKGFKGRFIRTVQNFGNTSSDSIPRAWHFANQEEKFAPNTKVCLIAFSAGLTVASALIELT